MTDTAEGLGWSPEEFEFYQHQYRNWLYLRRKYEKLSLPPSRPVDEFWHHHILDSRAYHRDCAAIFGYYLHHFPYFGVRGEQDLLDLHRAFGETQRRYLAEFGEPLSAYVAW